LGNRLLDRIEVLIRRRR